MSRETRTIQSIREIIKKQLDGRYPEREIVTLTEILFRHRLHLEPHEIGLGRQEILAGKDAAWFEKAARALRDGMPVQHITKETEFFGLRLRVSPQALIPRPETEELVQWILEDDPGPAPGIWDIGTGTGCIALALAQRLPQSRVFGTDSEEMALDVARENRRRLKLSVEFFRHDMTSEQPPVEIRETDILVSNPPYIPESEREALDPNVRDHDPATALFVPDEDPMVFCRAIARQALQCLVPEGKIYLEIHEDSGRQVRDLLENEGFGEITLRQDINGKDRMIRARKPLRPHRAEESNQT
jgi:release factor glutamine methyltransferase